MIDFQEIKASTSIEEVVKFLNLQLKQQGPAMRGKCPACESSDSRALAISTDRQAFYCFAAQKGGDMLTLISHVRGIGVRQAAQELADHIGQETVPPKPEVLTAVKEKAEINEPRSFGPLTYLQFENEAVQAMGLDPNTAERLGIGFANKGLMRGRVCFPVRDLDGNLHFYVGVNPALDPAVKLPKILNR